MKRLLSAFLFGFFCFQPAVAANVIEFTFPGITYPDGTVGNLHAVTKTTRYREITLCRYLAEPNDQYLGQYEDEHFASVDAIEVRDFCLSHYADRR